MILRARVVITMTGPPIENGAVAISGRRIVEVGTFDDVTRRHSGEIIDLGEQALLPGLINAHCHLDYTCLRNKIPRPASFPEWIRAINAAKTKLSPANYVASIRDGFEEAREFGTTGIANLTAFPELAAQIHEPIRTCWFAELIDIRNPEQATEFVAKAVAALDPKASWGLAPHAPFTASRQLFAECRRIAAVKNVLLTTHLAESNDEMSMFREARGQLYRFLAEIGRDMNDCGAVTPLGYFLELTRTSPNCLDSSARWIVTHLNELTEGDLDLLATRPVRFAVVHCPRSHKYFEHSPFQFDRLTTLGFKICLGTDSLASNEDHSLFAEMRAFQRAFPAILPQNVLAMTTTNAAEALRLQDSAGQIRPGLSADLIAVPCSDSRRAVEETIAWSQPVGWMMIAGEVQATKR